MPTQLTQERRKKDTRSRRGSCSRIMEMRTSSHQQKPKGKVWTP